MDGILLVDKPKGWSSFDVIRKLRSVTGFRKIGHAGTLDPMATGLLILLFGNTTKQAGRFLKLDKVYEAEISLGKTSTTDDAEGQLQTISDQPAYRTGRKPTLGKIDEVLQTFTGTTSQTPPSFSAIKVGGQRAYKLARKGAEVALQARPVTVHSLALKSYKYPKLQIETHVGSGTYIRSLARDIGQKLGSGAYLSGLRRTRIGEFSIRQAVQPDRLSKAAVEAALKLIERV